MKSAPELAFDDRPKDARKDDGSGDSVEGKEGDRAEQEPAELPPPPFILEEDPGAHPRILDDGGRGGAAERRHLFLFS
jgi:hypothetical protein